MLKNESISGTVLTKSEQKSIKAGVRVHGACNNGTHFTFIFNVDTYEDSLAQIRNTLCAGGGIAYMQGIQ